MPTITVMVNDEPLAVEMSEEEYRTYTLQELQAAQRLEEWRRKRDALNAADREPPSSGSAGVVAYGCMAALMVLGALLGVAIGLVFRH